MLTYRIRALIETRGQWLLPALTGVIGLFVLIWAFWPQGPDSATRRLLAQEPPVPNPIHHRGIVIHHSATDALWRGKPVNASLIDIWHWHRGFKAVDAGRSYHIGYHFVILPDGTIQLGRPLGTRGAHTRGATFGHSNNDFIGICLIGNFSSRANPTAVCKPARPTEEQAVALVRLLKALCAKYDIPATMIFGHRDLSPHTLCPGDRIDIVKVRAAVRSSMRLPHPLPALANPAAGARR
jgi:hypothetical protein